MKISRLIGLSLIAVLSSAGCAHPDVGYTYVKKLPSTNPVPNRTHYDYVADAERKKLIRSGYKLLRYGQTREQVRALMGPPDEVSELSQPKLLGSFEGWQYTYYLSQRSLYSGTGTYARLCFGPAGNLLEMMWQDDSN